MFIISIKEKQISLFVYKNIMLMLNHIILTTAHITFNTIINILNGKTILTNVHMSFHLNGENSYLNLHILIFYLHI